MSEIANFLGSSHLRPDGSTVKIQTRWALLDVDAAGALARAAKSLSGSGAKATVVFDRWTQFAKEEVARALVDVGVQVVPHEVQGGADGTPPLADTGRVRELERALLDAPHLTRAISRVLQLFVTEKKAITGITRHVDEMFRTRSVLAKSSNLRKWS